jgi:AbrB family looped-hinge helix DNA binding protein
MSVTAPTLPAKKQIAKITSKGQITVPVEIRQLLDVKAGDKLRFERKPDGTIFIHKEDEFPFNRFRGMGTGVPELEAGPDSIIQYLRDLRGHDEFDHLD